MVVSVTPLQDFCQEPRSMEELVEAGFKPYSVYNAVRRKELTNTKSTDDWGRRLYGKALFLSTVTPIPYNATLLVQAWSTPQPQGDIHV